MIEPTNLQASGSVGPLVPSIGNWIAQAVLGGTVGVGVIILLLAKWGEKFFGIKKSEPGQTAPCPYAMDHPRFQEFMGESTQDRKDMKGFLEAINGKVEKVSIEQGQVVGKLDLLLQGARVRWNSGLIPEDPPKRRKK